MEPAYHIQTAVVKAVHGDVDARAWLYNQYSKAMFNICIRMAGTRTDAEDILQDAFIIAFKNLQQLKQPENFGGWLKRIVLNECIRFSKQSFYWDDWQEEHNEIAADEITEWWTTVNIETVHKEIKNLPEGCRQVFVLYVLEDYTHKNIADDIGISESTSKSQYQRARQLLKERITKQMLING
ncbi:MAG: sigma-70 family RNA polymerase sigma factor [Ferruginibacter sp.]